MQIKTLKYTKKPLIGDLYKPPVNNGIEISVFGPGYGESIVIHLGSNHWVIVDSCITPKQERPAALVYLEKLGVAAEYDVKHIIASHFHDDHIRGLCELVKVCKSADFWCSSALRNIEFLTLLDAYKLHPLMESSGVDEFSALLDVLTSSNRNPKLIAQDMVIYRKKKLIHGRKRTIEISSLSPSHKAQLLSKQEFSRLLPKSSETKRAIRLSRPNDFSTVLLISVGTNQILLGSDLEVTNDQETGWANIIDNSTIMNGRCELFKIPHHGASTAFHDRVWTELLEEEPLVFLTPFRLGSVLLPSALDISRITSKTRYAYMTSPPMKTHRVKRPPTVRRTIKETVRNMAYYLPQIGHIRIRSVLQESALIWQVELFHPAYCLYQAN